MGRTRTPSRKQQHVQLTLSKDVSFRTTSAGFERWEFVHNALPEISLTDVDTSTSFLGKSLTFPLVISSMTGGYRDAVHINRALGEVCQSYGLAMGVGSQRQAMEDSRFHTSYSAARKAAPSIPLFGNIGAAEVALLRDVSGIRRLVDLIQADAFAVHLNPLQEFLQPEGNPEFTGVLRGIELLVRDLGVPIIVKEIGAGISAAVARRLLDAGVGIIDVAGAGGTSWAGVEILRSKSSARRPADVFWDWGIPTVDAVRQVAALRQRTPGFTLIASGGVTNGLEVAKSIALGADLAGSARPILQALSARGKRGVVGMLDEWKMQLRGAMFLTGSRTIAELSSQQLVLR